MRTRASRDERDTCAERDTLNTSIVSAINEATREWGLQCLRYEIRDIAAPQAVHVAMEMQAEAERRKRALILDSEGEQEAEVNVAKGKKAAAVLASEAAMQERVNLAKGEASAIEAQAVASAKAIGLLADAIRADGGADACGLRVAEQYVSAFKGLAASGSSVVVPANAGDVGGMVAQAMAVYRATAGSIPAGGVAGGQPGVFAPFAGGVAAPFMRSERPCALRDRSGGQGKDSSQGGGRSHAPVPRQRLRPENAPVRGLGKVTAPNFPPRKDRARACDRV